MHAPSKIYDSLSPLQCQCHERDLEDALGGGGFTMNSGLNTNIYIYIYVCVCVGRDIQLY